MKTESNRRVDSCTQRMAQNDFPLLSHLSPLPLVSQSDKHHKEPLSLHLFCYTSFIDHFFNTYFVLKIHNVLYACPSYMADYLTEDSLIGPVYGNILFKIFRDTKIA